MPNLAGNPARILKRKTQMLARRDGITDQEAARFLKDWEENGTSGSLRSELDLSHRRGPEWGVTSRKPSLDGYDR
jgi:hypothetical protein